MEGFRKEALREALDARGMSIRALARELDPISPETARSNIHRWLRGSSAPGRRSRVALAAALHVPVDHFDADLPADLSRNLEVALRAWLRAEMEKVA